MSFNINWCYRCTKEECYDRDEFFDKRQRLRHAPKLTEKERKEIHAKLLELSTEMRPCLRRRYFMFSKLCREGKFEEAGRLFDVDCEEIIGKPVKKSKSEGLDEWMK